MATKRVNELKKAKERRQRIMAAIGGVLLLALLAFQVPRTMKMLNQKAPPPPPAAVPGAPGAPVAPGTGTTTGTAAAAPGTPVPGGLPDSDVAPEPAEGQLASFQRFKSKNPFKQQLSDAELAGLPAPTPSKAQPKPASPKPTKLPTAPIAPSPAAPAGAATGTTGSEPVKRAPESAQITVNGVAETVAVAATFPQADPLFKLVSLTATSAKIAIAGGAYASGAPTVTLKKGKPLTLMNTADGTRYELRLVSTA